MSTSKDVANKETTIVISILVIAAILIVGVINIFSNSSNNDKKEQPVPSSQEKATPKLATYKSIATQDITTLRQERHYVFLGSSKPTMEDAKKFIEETSKECPQDKICDLMLWNSEASYTSRVKDDNGSSDTYAASNKTNLIAFKNSGGLEYYYGQPTN